MTLTPYSLASMTTFSAQIRLPIKILPCDHKENTCGNSARPRLPLTITISPPLKQPSAACLQSVRAAATGRWKHWYRGDRKCDWPKEHRRLQHAEVDAGQSRLSCGLLTISKNDKMISVLGLFINGSETADCLLKNNEGVIKCL